MYFGTKVDLASSNQQDQITQAINDIDGFSTYGVRIKQPELGDWVEISTKGRAYYPTSAGSSSNSSSGSHTTAPAESIRYYHHTTLSSSMLNIEENQLTDGTIIDIAGVHLLYRSPIAMAKTPIVS